MPRHNCHAETIIRVPVPGYAPNDGYHIPKVDNYEASVRTPIAEVRSGDRVATGWSSHAVVVSVGPPREGDDRREVEFRPASGGSTYTALRRTLPIIHD